MVSKLGLSTLAHPKPCSLHWLNDGNKVNLTKQVRLGLSMGSYVDEVLCDVIPMDACHVLLGRPWKFDRDVIHRGRSNEYELRDKGKRIVLKPMSACDVRSMSTKKKKDGGLVMLVKGREIEQAIKKGEMVYLLTVKGELGTKAGSYSNSLIDNLLVEYQDVFPDELPPDLPPIRGIEHQIDLIPGAPLPNKAAYRCNPEETKELQRQIDELVERGNIDDHLQHLRIVFGVLRNQKLFGKKEKSSFLVDSVLFLGYMVSKDGVSVDMAKIEAISTWPIPKTVSECKEKGYLEFVLQEGFLFNGNKLCVPKHPIRELLVREAHGGGLAGHFGIAKMLEVLKEQFFLPKMLADTDGQTEGTNRTLGALLRGLVSRTQKDWDVNLAHAEFAYNRSPTYATGHSPFEIVYGVYPFMPLDLIPFPKEELVHKEAEAKLKSMIKLHQQVREIIESVNAQYQRKSNKHKSPRVFQKGDLVWVNLRKERFPINGKNKLMPRAEGPYKVIDRVNDNAYKIELPGDYGVHGTFNVGDLSPYLDDDGLVELRSIPF
ncbi:uncharacterized protein LOC141619697 [Silene latifolia]|uniref:uncharacterized protein LOC141619697 n=1 Tax=Silene latifolia TaxID=37657 RepID=UPI003D77DDFD